MELRQLRHFVVLAEEMHFGRAATRLFMTQPALSNSLARLEEEMQVRLFERDSKAMSITVVGRAMLVRAQEIVSLADKFERFGRAMAAGRAGMIEVGFTGTLLYRGLAEILNRFSGAFAGRRQLDAKELQDDVFVMFSRDPSPAYYDHVIAICAAAGFQPKVRVAASQVLSIVALVASGLGVSLVPESVSKAGIAGAAYVPVRGVERQPSAFLTWNPQRDVPGLDALIQTVRGVTKAA